MAKIRFHLDEHVHPGIALGLRAQGVDVTTTNDANLGGSGDPDQLAFATQEGRVLVSHDDDFTRLHAQNPDHAGICYCHQQKHNVGGLLQALLLVHGCYEAEQMMNHLEFL